jgi:hypothetical protein
MKIVNILIIVIPGLIFGLLDKPTEMGLAIVAGAIAAAFLNLEKIQRFKGAGFEAEMKAEVQQVVNEAYATMDKLREIAKPLIITCLNTMTVQGRFFSNSEVPVKVELQSEIKKAINSLSINDQNVSEALNKFHRYHTWDIFRFYIREVALIDRDKADAIQNLVNYDSSNFPTREKVQSIVAGIDVSPTGKEWLEDFFVFAKDSYIRRPEAFTDSD